MKQKLFLLGLLSVLLMSCEKGSEYQSGMYYYHYYIVNATSSTLSLDGITIENYDWEMKANDTILFMAMGIQNEAGELLELHRPSLQDGYEGVINAAEYEITYQDKVYKVDESQTNSFSICSNYKGVQSPQSDFIYEYYFIIDENYIATLPLKSDGTETSKK